MRAYNDEALVGKTLSGIFAQWPPPFEVVVCDDNSKDRTREIAAGFPVRFVERPPGPYKPGRTLNALVRAAKGDIVVFNNSDAVPCDPHWLAKLVEPLLAGRFAFTFANQLPRPDAQALVRKDSERAFGDGTVQARGASSSRSRAPRHGGRTSSTFRSTRRSSIPRTSNGRGATRAAGTIR